MTQALLMPLRQRVCFDAVGTFWHTLIRIAFDPYRPELHYMRRPGPKWYAKHESGDNAAL